MPFESPFDSPFAPRRPRNVAELLTAEAENELLGSLAGSTLGGLAYVGSSLDKALGGRAVRAGLDMLMGGDTPASELLSIIPFSDAMGLTDESNAISGRELLDPMLGPNRDGFNPLSDPMDAFGDVLGFGAEIALDPGTYLTFGAGALTKPGQALAKAGGLKGLSRADQVAQGLRGVAGARIPFTNIGTQFGAGTELGAKIGGAMDSTADALLYGNLPMTEFSPGRQLSALFDKSVKGTTSEPLQRAARQMSDLERAGQEAGLGEAIGVYRQLEKLGLGDNQYDLLSRAVEGRPLLPEEEALLGANRAAFDDIVTRMQGGEAELRDSLIALGRPVPELVPENMDYFSRYLSESAASPRGSKVFAGKFDSGMSRNEFLRNVPRDLLNDLSRGTRTVDDVMAELGVNVDALRTQKGEVEELLRGATDFMGRPAPHYGLLEQRYGVGLPTDELLQKARGEISDLTTRIRQPDELARMFAEPSGKPLYGDPVRDYARYQAQARQTQAATEGLLDFFAKHATPIAPGQTSMLDVLKSTGFATADEVTPEAAQQFFQRGSHQLAPGQDPLAALAGFGLDANLAHDAKRMIEGFKTPEALAPALEAFDKFTGMFKTGVTTPWPSFHVRNAVTGLWQNYVGGALDKQSYADAFRLMRGETIAEALQHPKVVEQGITDAKEASDFLRDMAYQYNVAGQSWTKEISGQFITPNENFAGQIIGEPGNTRSFTGILDAGREGIQAGRAAGGNRLTSLLKGAVGGAVGAGQHAGDFVESANRIAGFLSLTKQGFDPSMAAAKIRAMHVDFGNLSGFEKSVMRRAVPFWSFTKGMLPQVLKEIAERPGGPTGQLAQTASYVREGQDAFLPEYLQGGLGIPVGEEANGNQRFLTGLDLPAEGVFESIHTGPNAVTDTGMALLGMTNPLLKIPFEYATGKQFFTGRDLRDLHANTGSVLGDQLIGLTPLARVPSVVNTLTDERKGPLAKGINLLTGARLSDVDVDKYKSILARELIEDELRGTEGVGFFEHLYANEDSLAAMTPEEQQLFALYRQLSNRAQKAAREKKQDQRIGLVR